MNILFLTRYGRLGASSRLRSFQFLPYFEEAGFNCTIMPLIDDVSLKFRYKKGRYNILKIILRYMLRIRTMMHRNNYDLVWIEKEALPWFPAWFEKKLLGSVAYVIDYDDAIFHIYDHHNFALVRWFYHKHIDHLMTGAKLVIVGNDYLAKRAYKAGASLTRIVPTVIDLNKYFISPSFSSTRKKLAIVWIGSPSTIRYLELLREPLFALSKQFSFKFRIIGGGGIYMPGVDVEIVEWEENTEVKMIKDCDIGVMPLFDSPWEKGKCGYKLIQYMACSLPVVASPVGINCEIVRNDENGFLAKCANDWVQALGNLLGSAVLRQRMGKIGRKLVESEYCVEKTAPRLVTFLCNVIKDARKDRAGFH